MLHLTWVIMWHVNTTSLSLFKSARSTQQSKDSNQVDLYIKIKICRSSDVQRCEHNHVILFFGSHADFVRPTIRAQCCNQDVQKPKCDFDWLHALLHVACVEQNLKQTTTCKSTWARSILRYIHILLLRDFNCKLLLLSLMLSRTQCTKTEGTVF